MRGWKNRVWRTGVLKSSAVVLGVAGSLVTSPVAADPGAEELAVAQQLYQDAREQQERKQWGDCERSLGRAIAILETPGLRFHLAYCKEQQHRWVEALVDYRRASELIAGGVAADDVELLLPAAIGNLERLTPRLELELVEPPPDAELYLDAKQLSAKLFGTSVPVDPGARRIRVTASGHVPFSQSINLLPKERRKLRVELVREPPPDAAPGSVASDRTDSAPREVSSSSATQVVVLAAEALITLGALGVGVGFTAEASSRERDRDNLLNSIGMTSRCSGSSGEHPLCIDVRKADADARNARTVATLGYVGAGVGAAAFLVTWLVWPDDEPAQASSAARLRFIPDATGAGLSLTGRF